MRRVTVLIPCFNAGEALVESVRSALDQTYRDRTIVVVNDGSTDPGTLEALATVRAMQGVDVLDQPRRGVPAARNAGLRHAPADYVQPLDADDLISPDYVATAVRLLDDRPELGVVYGPAEFFGTRSGRFVLPRFSADGLAVGNMVHVGGMFRYADWLRIGGYRESLLALSDYDFWIRMCELGRGFEEVPDITYFYRQGANLITSSYADDFDLQSERYAAVFRANSEFFLGRLEAVFRQRFAQERRVGELESLMARISSPAGSLRWAAASCSRPARRGAGRIWSTLHAAVRAAGASRRLPR